MSLVEYACFTNNIVQFESLFDVVDVGGSIPAIGSRALHVDPFPLQQPLHGTLVRLQKLQLGIGGGW